jgi:hypothetical protein
MVMWRSARSALLGLFLLPAVVLAQAGVGGGGGAQGGGNQGQNQGGGQLIAGVEVDPSGVFKMILLRDPNGRLTRERIAATRQVLDGEISREVERRYISLNRLEAAIADCLEAGKPIPDEMQYLGGLTGIRNVFFFPETNDIVIAGPAEGFMRDLSGRVVGIETGRSVLELQDLVVALRAFSPVGSRTNLISVSIDATQEGLSNMQKYYAQVAPRAKPADAKKIAAGMKKALGMQDVTIRGISPKTHFAQVLVEADYRMKLIGIGLEMPAAKIESYVARANPQQIARNAMERWFFVPNYECIVASEDGLAMEMVGDGVKLIGENERVAANGQRANSGEVNPASQAFVAEFTERYPQLAVRTPVYGQLKNLIDMSIAAAYIQQQDFHAKAGWQMPVFGSEEKFPVEVLEAPRQVESAVNVLWKGNLLMTPIGGGVQIRAQEALLPSRVRVDDQRNQISRESAQQRLSTTRWWWD